MKRLFAILILLLAPLAATAQETLAQDRWLRHLKEDLLPFWDTPAAHGDPVGLFPSMRCDDGARFDPDNPCSEITRNDWMTPQHSFVLGISRQSFAYATAFHMTGDKRYLDLAKEGIDILFGRGWSDELNGNYEGFDTDNWIWWSRPEGLNVQKQTYVLLAPAMYYYLTRDQGVLDGIRRTRSAMIANYGTGTPGVYKWLRNDSEETSSENRLTAYLDQINTFYMLITPLLEGAEQEEWAAELKRLADRTSNFHDAQHNLYHDSGSKRDNQAKPPRADYGHAAKSNWFLMMVGDFVGDDAMTQTALARGKKMLNTSFRRQQGNWSQGFNKRGKPTPVLQSWVHAEQNQLLASLALSETRLTNILDRTNKYWLRAFVDQERGGIFNAVPLKGKLRQVRPKHWAWKSGFHEFEHALVAYITSARFEGKPLMLHYAFEAPPAEGSVQPYYFSAPLQNLKRNEAGVDVATFGAPSFP